MIREICFTDPETGERRSRFEELTAEEIAERENHVPPVPEMVTLYQGRVALRRAGLFDTVKALVLQPGHEEAWEAFEYANHWFRNAAWIGELAPALGMTSEDIDDLFRAAEAID